MYEQEITINAQSITIFLVLIILMLGRGIYFLLSSPCVFRMDKKKNCCTKEKKFIWQKEYNIKTLCKLSEVKEALMTSGILLPNWASLRLQLKSGKVITIFCDIYAFNQLWASKNLSKKEYNKQASEINKFLQNNQNQYVVEKPLLYWGIFWVLSGCILLTVILLIMYNPFV